MFTTMSEKTEIRIDKLVGRHHFRRALEVAMAGGHSIFLLGSVRDVRPFMAVCEKYLVPVHTHTRNPQKIQDEIIVEINSPTWYEGKSTYPNEADEDIIQRAIKSQHIRFAYVNKCERFDTIAMALLDAAQRKGIDIKPVVAVSKTIAAMYRSFSPITGADLDQELLVTAVHVAEALQYRHVR